MTTPMKITVLAGGLSHERDVSLSSGSLVAGALVRCGHEVCLVDLYTGLDLHGEKPAFTLESKEPDWDKFEDFLLGEVRYSSLKRSFPEAAEALFEKTKKDAQNRLAGYKKLAGK